MNQTIENPAIKTGRKPKHKAQLPGLTAGRLNIIFEQVYVCVEIESASDLPGFSEPRLQDLLKALQAQQYFNYQHRYEDLSVIYPLVSRIFNFDQNSNSEGSSIWLALILAIKELYGFSNARLAEVMKLVDVRK